MSEAEKLGKGNGLFSGKCFEKHDFITQLSCIRYIYTTHVGSLPKWRPCPLAPCSDISDGVLKVGLYGGSMAAIREAL